MARRTQWELFLDRHRPIKNHLDESAAQDGLMFETFGAEWEFVKSQDCHRVFTLVEGDTGPGMYACSGFHIVNRQGYFVVEVPWNDGNEHKVYKT
jgi:hypothetical protein